MVHLIEEILLTEYVPLLAELHYLLLVHLFDRNRAPSSNLCRQHDAAVGTLTEYFAELVLIKRAGGAPA